MEAYANFVIAESLVASLEDEFVKGILAESFHKVGNRRYVLAETVWVGRAVPLAGREPQLISHVSEYVAARSSRAALREMPVTSISTDFDKVYDKWMCYFGY